MKSIKKLNAKRARRARRSSARIMGTAERPRLAVHRTNRFMHAQLIDDMSHRTMAFASNIGAKEKATKSAGAFAVGETIAKKALEKGIKTAVFDRRSYKFHGRVKNVADGAKKGGLKI
jgi:large subunit ribosomal protein L18